MSNILLVHLAVDFRWWCFAKDCPVRWKACFGDKFLIQIARWWHRLRASYKQSELKQVKQQEVQKSSTSERVLSWSIASFPGVFHWQLIKRFRIPERKDWIRKKANFVPDWFLSKHVICYKRKKSNKLTMQNTLNLWDQYYESGD